MTRKILLQIRLTADEKSGFESAASIAGIHLSAWVRERLRISATQELAKIGQLPPFLKPITIESNES
jgi:hypothetical protein